MQIRRNPGVMFLELILWVLSLTILIPFLVMILGSLKSNMEVTSFNLSLPSQWHFENYLQVITQGNMVRAFLNSFFITAVSVVVTIITTSMAAFIIARKQSKVTEFLYYFFFIGMIAPMQIIPTIRLFQFLHLNGSYLSVIIIYSAINMGFSTFLYTGFIKTIPKSLDEAALMEGASLIRVFFVVIFPLLKPINMTIMIIVFMNIWNDINIPIFFLSDPSKWTLPLSVYKFFGMYSGSNWNLVFANLVLTALPVIIIYLIGQRHIVSGMTSGAVK